MTNETIRLTGLYMYRLDSSRPLPTKPKEVTFEIDKKEALRTGYITSDYKSPDVVPFLFGKLEPLTDRGGIGAHRCRDITCFDHVLSEDEAWGIVWKQMRRYDEMVLKSLAMRDRHV